MIQHSNSRKKIVLAGCTGFVGRQLVLELEALNIELLLVARNTEAIDNLFPGRNNCDYDSLGQCGKGYDTLVHLAVLNNDRGATEAEFNSVNVDFAVHTARLAQKAGICEFVHLSSFHALDLARKDPYASSKRTAAVALQQVRGINVVNLYLPAVYGSIWSGKLRRLNALPRWLARAVFSFFAAWRPTVHIRNIAHFLADMNKNPRPSQVYIADDQDKNPFYRISMRAMDLVFATVVLIFLGWLLALLWALVRLESRGPGIFSQPRVGKAGKIFTCYKFRTMHLGTRQAATHELAAASVTRVGKFLRATKLDELPQILNIFRNEVSLIGPRPCLPVQEELVASRRTRGVFSMKPGITGFAQINGVDMSEPAHLARVDAQYGAMRSIPLNLKIALSTFVGRGQGDKIGSG